MSFWSALGKIASIAAPIAAIPFTGGASALALGASAGGGVAKALPGILGAVGDASSVLGKQQEAKAQGEMNQAALNQRQDANALSLYQAQQAAQNQAAQLDLQRKQFEAQNRGGTAKQALIGALLDGGLTPTSMTNGVASGGLVRSLNANPDALAAMKLLGTQGSAAQAAPAAFTGGNVLAAPTLTALPKIDQGGVLSTLANLGQLAGAASPYVKKVIGNGSSGTDPYFDQRGV